MTTNKKLFIKRSFENAASGRLVLSSHNRGHHPFKYPDKKGRATVKHPDKDVPHQTLNSIERQSGLRFR